MDKALFQEYPEDVRRQMLEDNCDRIEEVGYMKPFTGEQLLEMKDRLSDLSIEINDIEIEKKASAELFKAQLKPLTEERGKLLDNIRNKAEHTKEKCFKFVDQEAGYVGYYSKDGFLVESRAASIKTSISNAEDHLFDANRAETERISRMGWGYGMRHSKLNFSTSKSDRIKERINSLKVNLDKVQRTIEFVKSMK